MKLQPYARVSTDDKGQDPQRQVDVIRDWCQRHGHQMLEPLIDEGTSAYKVPDPFDRPVFLQAVEIARVLKADGLVVENDDRFTRGGVAVYFATAYRLNTDHGLKLYQADLEPSMQEGQMMEIFAAVRAAMRHEDSRRKSQAVASGMRRAMAHGKRMGRPPKPLAPAELELGIQLRQKGLGWGTIAHRLNTERGVYDLSDPQAQRRRRVSASVIRRAVLAASEVEDTQEPFQKSERAKVGRVS